MSNEIIDVFAAKGINEIALNTLRNSIFNGAKDESIAMAVDYCISRNLDIMMKPVHLVPMSVKVGNQYIMKDTVMPGIGLYRIQADRSGNYAGADEPIFGPSITKTFNGKNGEKLEFSYPEFCVYSVHKIVGSHVVKYSAKEFWLENYATKSHDSEIPNAMWKKRPYAQLANIKKLPP